MAVKSPIGITVSPGCTILTDGGRINDEYLRTRSLIYAGRTY